MRDYGWDGWTETDRATHEIRLVSNSESRLRWTAGVWSKESTDWSWSGVLYQMNAGREQYSPLYFFNSPETSHETEFTERAVFGEVSYDLMPTLELTAGARVAKLDQDFMIGVHGARLAAESEARTPEFATYATYVPRRLGKQDDDAFSPKVVLTWRPEDRDLMAYVSYSTGFRPGSANRGVLLTANNLIVSADALERTGGNLVLAGQQRARAAELQQLVFFSSDTRTSSSASTSR